MNEPFKPEDVVFRWVPEEGVEYVVTKKPSGMVELHDSCLLDNGRTIWGSRSIKFDASGKTIIELLRRVEAAEQDNKRLRQFAERIRDTPPREDPQEECPMCYGYLRRDADELIKALAPAPREDKQHE